MFIDDPEKLILSLNGPTGSSAHNFPFIFLIKPYMKNHGIVACLHTYEKPHAGDGIEAIEK